MITQRRQTYSSLLPLTCSVPQGSVLGPILFISYTDDVPSVFRRHQVNYHLYADDKQAYVSVPVSDISQARTGIGKMRKCGMRNAESKMRNEKCGMYVRNGV